MGKKVRLSKAERERLKKKKRRVLIATAIILAIIIFYFTYREVREAEIKNSAEGNDSAIKYYIESSQIGIPAENMSFEEENKN